MTASATDDIANRLAEIEARVKAATKGPWYTVGAPWLPRDCTTYVIAGHNDPHAGVPVCDFEVQVDDETEEREENADADAEFIAHARSDIPWLLSLVQKMKAGRAAPAGDDTT